MEARVVILFGRSMLLSLMAASVNQGNDLRVLQTDSWEEVLAFSTACPPDVVFYDLPNPAEGHLLSLLYKNPQLLLVGMDVEANRAILLTGQATGSLTLERVKEIVQGSYTVEPPA